jgi:hypothetical protein
MAGRLTILIDDKPVVRKVLEDLLTDGPCAVSGDTTLKSTDARLWRPTPPRCFGFLALAPREPELRLLHRWLDTWSGIGHVVPGMARQEYDLELRRYDGRGWRAMFFPSGFEHSLTSHAGAAWARSPWETTPRAAAERSIGSSCGEPAPREWTLTDESPV